MDLYGQLVIKRREADRRAKQRSPNLDAAGVEISVHDLSAIAVAASRGTEIVFDDIAEYLAERDGLECSHCGGHWHSHLAQEFQTVALPDPLALTVACGCERVERPYSLPLEEFQSLAGRFMTDSD